MEHRVHIDYVGPLSEEDGDRLLDALIAEVPDWGPVLAGDAQDFTVTVAFDAESFRHALEVALARVGPSFVAPALGRELVEARAAEVELVELDPEPVTAP